MGEQAGGVRIVADGLNKIQPGQPVRVARAAGRPGQPGARPAGANGAQAQGLRSPA